MSRILQHFKNFITINNPDNFFETIISAYSIKELKWKQYRDQLEFSIIEFDTTSQKYKTLNHKYNLIYASGKRNKWSPADYVHCESYCFTGEEYNRLNVFLEMSDQKIEITPYNVAFYYVTFCEQNKIKMNESKVDNYVERMQQPLIPDTVKEDFKKITLDHAINFTKKVK